MRDGQASTVAETTSTNMTSLSTGTKYGGLVNVSLSKKIRNILFILVSYMESVVGNHQWIFSIVTYLRLIQLAGASLVAGMEGFWQPGAVGTAMGVISVTFHLIPHDYRDLGALVFLYIYFIAGASLIGVIMCCAVFFNKYGKMSPFLANMIEIFQGTCGYWLHPIAWEFFGEVISRWIADRQIEHWELHLVALIFSLATFALYVWYLTKVAAVGLLFKPLSLPTLEAFPQILTLMETCAFTFILALSTHLPLIPRVVMVFLTAVLYLVTSIYDTVNHGYIVPLHQKLKVGICLAAVVNLIIVGVCLVMKQQGNEVILIIMLATFPLGILCGHFLVNCSINRKLMHLDLIEDDNDNIDILRSPKQVINHVMVGFQFVHPVCLSWQIFLRATERWPESVQIWMVFAKFCAIYPEENNRLEWIRKTMISRKLTGALAKLTIEQTRSVLGRRENNLSPVLKRKLSGVSKKIAHAKQKLRSIWDLVIQGNIKEMEINIKKAYNQVETCDTEFAHILTLYPNNRFLARSYARYLREVKADYALFMEWRDKVYMLQRGVQVQPDAAHELGVAAFPMLPAVNANTGVKQNTTIVDSEIMSTEVDIEEDNGSNPQSEQVQLLRDSIQALKIPSHRICRCITLFAIIVLIVAPVVACLIYAHFFITGLTEPLNFVYHTSILRSLSYQTTTFATHLVLETLPWIYNQDMSLGKVCCNPPQLTGFKPVAFGGYETTREQLKYQLSKIPTSLQGIASMRGYAPDSDSLDQARLLVFESTIPYTFYLSINESYTQNVSLQDVLSDFHMQMEDMLSLDLSDRAILSTSQFLNPINNCGSIGTALTNTLTLILGYLSEMNDTLQMVVLILEICAPVALTAFMALAGVLTVRKMNKQKVQIYKCLTVLPKNVVSQVNEGLRMLKKDDGSRSTEMDSELSKQEENILKIFSAASDTGTKNIGNGIYYSCGALIVAFGIVAQVLTCNLYSVIGTILVNSAPHIDALLGAYGFMIGSFLSLFNILLSLVGYNEIDPDPYYLLDRYYTRINSMSSSFHDARYGNGEGVVPFSGLEEGVRNARERMECEDRRAVPTSMREVTKCLSATEQFQLIEGLLYDVIQPYKARAVKFIDSRTDEVTQMWEMGAVVLYEIFFYDMLIGVVDSLLVDFDSYIPTTTIPVVCMIVLVFVCEIVILINLADAEKRLKFCLSLLLHCPINVVMQTKKIAAVLSGDFSESHETATRNNEFFDQIVQNLMDGVIVAEMDQKIISVNAAVTRMMGVEKEDLIGKDIIELLSDSSFKLETDDLSIPEGSGAIQQREFQGQYVFDGKQTYLSFVLGVVQRKIVVTMRDQTQIVLHGKLITEERQKSDKLLGSILPPSLVPRVQAGEQNISFAVQSATVSFIDIVEFTPWCASNTAAKVMATLNQLFKAFDALINERSTLTKIKCIGDCYMSAGGIFSEVNQPSVHSKEMVDFGLEAIAAVEHLDEETGEKLRIRVGVNTGGPIVAGVLGIGKPTFEILGPAINMAQQMEHNGVPMKVHISRPVYELIYGAGFVVKERGQIEVKNGQVYTYLVSGRK